MRCHYEVLEVLHDATIEEIKKQYKKLALIYHPDRNPDRLDWATEQFKELSSSYQILSDPNERKWYDDHRDSILRAGESDLNDEYNLNLWQFFNNNCFDGFDDSDPKGFYHVYNSVFNIIYQREISKTKKSPSYPEEKEFPSFGNNSSPASQVKAFYSYWSNFSSCLSFSWEDKYNTNEAPNRTVRRAIEKENQKIRDSAKKSFNNLVQTLVKFVKKRDPRIIKIEIETSKKLIENENKRKETRKADKMRKKEEKEMRKSSYENDEEELKRRDNERQRAFLIADNSSSDEFEEINDNNESKLENITVYLSDADLTKNKSSKNTKSRKKTKNSKKVLSFDGYNIEEQEIQLQQLLQSCQSDINKNDIEDDTLGGSDFDVLVVLHCETCNKTFKSTAQMTQHLQSKSHKKIESSIIRKMKRINKNKLSLSEQVDENNFGCDETCSVDRTCNLSTTPDQMLVENSLNDPINNEDTIYGDSDVSSGSDDDIERLSRNFSRSRILQNDSASESSGEDSNNFENIDLVDKKKHKSLSIQNKPKSKQIIFQNNIETSWSCRECGFTADSKNKLHQHLRSTDHMTIDVDKYDSLEQNNAKVTKKKKKVGL